MRTQPAGAPLLDSFHIYDTTLRDGAQQEGISYSVTEKLAVARLLDSLGVGFIEGGWPGALPRDTEFFRRAAAGELTLRHAALAAFGSTRKAGTRADRDPQVRALLDSEAPVVTLVAKADRRHIERALRTDPAENRAMIADTVRLLVAEGRRVFLDAEHFFDGYQHDPDTALGVLDAAAEAGADVLVLCDTNGGNLPLRLAETVETVRARTGLRLGIHCQDDTGCAVANTVAAVAAGVTHVQCTANGYGERAGNADLFAVIGNLVTKLDLPVLPEGRLGALVGAAEAIAALADIADDPHQPYVGASAFTHKAGLHASGVKADPELYNHIDPLVVGNGMRVLVTEMAGRASLELKGAELGLDLRADPDALTRSIARVKELEAAGWSFEAADASLELLLRAELAVGTPRERPADFRPVWHRVVSEHRADGTVVSEATVGLRVGTERAEATASGEGPVRALEAALRRALAPQLPWLDTWTLSSYQIRVLDEGSRARVLAVSHDGEREWTTVGANASVIEAAVLALADAVAFQATRLARGG
ncbi:citramalate synthase [Streptomyces profundus]|uniref:citramalate synthase n=1 Tax=Streptomyces profundus TaxID=2867410 RepID=UPI001D15F360|nr:citramalate synthase [Streptomyces sp. MA3_2.13]UED87783.1 citramalate synthase [Streptomyces sp. MA3_2.13]